MAQDEIEFEWDSEKERVNQEKHGITFQHAKQAFNDPCRIIVNDHKHSAKEERKFCIGKIEGRIITVRYVIRDGVVRIFGAAEWRNGRRLYEQRH